MRGVYYRYNTETDNFERIYPSVWDRLRVAILLVICCGITAVVIYVICYYSFSTSVERQLREDNLKLQREYVILRRRVEQTGHILRKIEDRDRTLYNILLQNDSMASSPTFITYQNKIKHNKLQDMDSHKIIKAFNNEVDLLEHRLYEQIQFFKELDEQLRTMDRELCKIPSVLPLERRYAELVGTFGLNLTHRGSKFHEGVDFIAPTGVPVYATAHGRVVNIDNNSSGFNVTLQHEGAYTSVYSHLGKIIVKQGQEVVKGEVIGFVGETEKNTSSSYLHYEVRYNNQPENPLDYFYLDFTPEEYERYLNRAEDAVKVID